MAESFTIERDGCRLRAWLHGQHDAPLIACTHGAGADHWMFDAQVQALATTYRVLTWDVRGHGESRPLGAPFTIARAAADFVAILDMVGNDRAVLLGHSMGGNIAQEVVRAAPERVSALVLIDCVCNTFPLARVERWAARLTPGLLRLYPREALLRQSANAVSQQPEVRRYLYETMRQLSSHDIVAILAATLDALHSDPDYRIPVPFLLLRGEQDRAGAIARQAPRWAARDPNCRYVVVPNAGHCANQDNPGAVNALIQAFLAAQCGVRVA